MPNLYITPAEIKNQAPDAIRSITTKYDPALLRMCDQASRLIDIYCNVHFYPEYQIRYYPGNGEPTIRVDYFLSIEKIEYSEDEGATYTELTINGNVHYSLEGNQNTRAAYNTLELDPNGDLVAWPTGFRSLKITGVYCYVDIRGDAWQDSQDKIQDDPLTSSATTITVGDVDGSDILGLVPRFKTGQLIQVESEYIEIVGTNEDGNTLTVLRGRNGSTAAEHAKEVQVDIWQPPDPVKRAAEITVVRSLGRAQQGYSDTRADNELGQLIFIKRIDPEAQVILKLYRDIPYG